jgi:hypothetical protein
MNNHQGSTDSLGIPMKTYMMMQSHYDPSLKNDESREFINHFKN